MLYRNMFWILLLFSCCIGGKALTPSTYLTAADSLRLKKLFNSAFPLTDVTSAHYAVLGLSLIGEKIPDSEGTCKFLNSKIDKKHFDTIFHATSASKYLTNCKISSSSLQQVLQSTINEESSLQDVYYAVISLKNLNLNVDSAKTAKVLTAALKKDDSVLNLGYAFHVASKLQGDFTPFLERIEDAIVQADEVDGKYLQFEGGLGITSTTISGVYHLAEAAKKAPAVTADQAVKFTNYFLSRKFVQTVKGAAQLLDILNILTTNKFHIPVAVTLASSSAVSNENPSVQIRISNVLGASLGPLTVTADSATRIGDEVVVFSKKQFQTIKGSDMLYSLNFMEGKPLCGFYKLLVSATPTKADPRFVGNTAAQIDVKVMTEVGVESFEIGTVDREQSTPAKMTSVRFPKELEDKLEADFHQKLFIKFALKDKNAKKPMSAHQAFVQFVKQPEGNEVFFVAESDNSNAYRFDLDVHTKSKEFGQRTGDYDINLIVGDAVITNPFTWKVGKIHLTFPGTPVQSKPAESPYVPKPEIKHLFREQDKRPSTFVSNTFSGLVLVPFLMLLILWIKLGANISNFPFSLAAVGFHLGLGAIFGLFACFWLHLDMFATLKYLSGLGLIVFLCGHSLLRKLAFAKK